jgi:hypothetical protein
MRQKTPKIISHFTMTAAPKLEEAARHWSGELERVTKDVFDITEELKKEADSNLTGEGYEVVTTR